MHKKYSDNRNVPREHPSNERMYDLCALEAHPYDHTAYRSHGRTKAPCGLHSEEIIARSPARIDLWHEYITSTPPEDLANWWQISLWPKRPLRSENFDGSWKLPFKPDTHPMRPDESVWSRIELLCRITNRAGMSLIIHRPARAPRKSPNAVWWKDLARERLLPWKHVLLSGSWGGAEFDAPDLGLLRPMPLALNTPVDEIWEAVVLRKQIVLARMENPPKNHLPDGLRAIHAFDRELYFEWASLRELHNAATLIGPGTVRMFSNRTGNILVLARGGRANGIRIIEPDGCWTGAWYSPDTAQEVMPILGHPIYPGSPAVFPTVRLPFAVALLSATP